MTGQQLITRALKAIGVVAAGEVPSADMSQDALDILNSMVKMWNVDGTSLAGQTIAAYALTSGKQTYTIGGPGLAADFDALRPTRITDANLISTATTPNVRFPLNIIDYDQWADIRLQAQPTSAYPTKIYPDMAFPLTTLYLWGVPAANLQLELFTWEQIVSFTLGGTFVLPGEYEEALIYNLAVRLLVLFPGANPSPLLPELAGQSLAKLQKYNAVTPIMAADAAVVGATHGIFNILSGEVN